MITRTHACALPISAVLLARWNAGPALPKGPDVYYERRGRGAADAPAIVFLHGLGSCADDWTWQIPAFERDHRLLLVDLPGHYRSPLPAGPLSVDAMADAVGVLLARLGEPPAHVVGLSLGGCVALALALRAPERVRSLTVVNAFARPLPAGRAGGALRGGGAQPGAHLAAHVPGRAARAGRLRRAGVVGARTLSDAGRGRRRRRDGGAGPEGSAGAGDPGLALGDRAGLGSRDERRPSRHVQRHAARLPRRALRRACAARGVQSPPVWLALALMAALFQVLRNTTMKRLGHVLDEYINVWGRFTFLLPFALLTGVARGFPAIQPGFWGWCLLFGVSQTLSTLALSKALKASDISLVTALWKVSLLVLLGMAWVTIGERPNALGVTGVLLSATGVYLLNISRARLSPWAPLVVLVTDRGQRWTLVAAFFYAPSVITIKQAILASNAAMGTFGGYLAASLMMTPIALATSARHFRAVPRYWREFVALGLFAALTTITQGHAYTLTLSSYVEAVKQVEILFAMAVGVLLFGEAQRVREFAAGAVVMLIGMILLALAS